MGCSLKKRSWEAQRRVDQQNWYDEMHTTQVKLKLNNKTDADILLWIYTQSHTRGKSAQGEIKRLIRQEIESIQNPVGVHRQESPSST